MQRNMWAEGREKERIKESKKERIRKNMAKRENERYLYRNGGFGLPHRVSTSRT